MAGGPTASIGIFCKAPVPGRVKTRLAPELGAELAASLYTAFLVDTVTLALRSPAARVLLFHDGPPPSLTVPGLPPDPNRVEIPQTGGDLGARLAQAGEDAAARGCLPLVFLGSDSPDLPPGHLEGALQAIHNYDIVLGPASDGGVWCIGLARPIPGLLGDLPWSQDSTGQALRNRARSLGLKLGILPEWMDVDHPADLDRLAHRLASGQTMADATRQWLASRRNPRQGDLS